MTNVIEVKVDDNPLLAQILQLAKEIQHEDVLRQTTKPPINIFSHVGYINTSNSRALVSSTSVSASMSLSNNWMMGVDKLGRTSRSN
ncbi:hypothetical protein DPMN_002867 [Dreissena polymorpha]|uniref:Uncharacterized protein n=1 Tax=Dreissena polymorpha TaxID=45954 RepID=A0A9D4MNX9_DREPO|nr:hypothetical protein DPMN_002867 [Dreissena polymorpha]